MVICSDTNKQAFFWILVVLGTVGVLTMPVFWDKPCKVDRDVNASHSATDYIFKGGDRPESPVPAIGRFFATGLVAGILLGILLDPFGRIDTKHQIHRWVRRYCILVILQAFVQCIYRPLILALCPSNLFGIEVWRHAGISNGIGSIAYVGSQLTLSQISLLRLRVVASTAQVTRATRFFRAVMMLGACLCVVYAFTQAGLLPDIANIITCIVVLLVAYFTFQSYVFTVLAEIMRDALEGARLDRDDIPSSY